ATSTAPTVRRTAHRRASTSSSASWPGTISISRRTRRRRKIRARSTMIVDKLARGRRYRSLHPGFAKAFEFLTSAELKSMPAGRQDLDGERLYVSIEHATGRGRDGARLEAHRKYIDIQVTIDGAEEIGWMPLADCRNPSGAFMTDNDVGFFNDRP